MRADELNGDHVFTRNIAAAANLIAIGARIRQPMPVTATRAVGKPDDVLFWFENGPVECGGDTKPAASWLTLFLCPWSDFKLSLDHPAAFLKAAAENRQILIAGAKRAQEQPFRVIQRGNRVAVIGPAVSETNARRLLSQG
jgi:hypothetical protein